MTIDAVTSFYPIYKVKCGVLLRSIALAAYNENVTVLAHCFRNIVYLFLHQKYCLRHSSVRPSVCLSYHSTAAVARGRFAAERPADRTYRSIAAYAGVQQQRRRSTALSSKCRQCRVDSRVDEAEHGRVYGCYAMRSKWQVDLVRRHRDG